MSVLPIGIGSSGSYSIANSLRYRASAGAYMSRVFGTPTDNKKWTFAGWGKRGKLGSVQDILVKYAAVNPQANLRFDASDRLEMLQWNGSSYDFQKVSAAVFRDPTAWLHIVCIFDSSNGTAEDRNQLWVNGTRLTSFSTSTNSGAGTASSINTASVVHQLGRSDLPGNYFDGYLSDVYFIDGQALTPSSFGETNSDGVWVPKAYTGTYGNNGFYLKFNDGTSATTLGYDRSGNGNNWTASGISTTAGVTYDWFTDTPTNNYCTLSPINKPVAPLGTFADANLKLTSSDGIAFGSMPIPTTGKWLFEGTLSTLGVPYYGLANATKDGRGSATGSYGAYCNGGNGLAFYNGSNVAADGRQAVAANDIALVAVDSDNNKVWIGRNRSGTITWMGNGDPVAGTSPSFSAGGGGGVYSTSFSISSSDWYPCFGAFTGDTWYPNFGQRAMSTTLAGFKALCTANLPAVAIKQPNKNFDVDTWAGTGSALSRTNWQFKPGLLWGKIRSGADYHVLANEIVGSTVFLKSNTTDSETTNAQTITAFDAAGFSLGTSTDLNRSGYTFVGWGWKAGGTPTTDNVAGAGNTPTAGSVKIDGVNLGTALAGTIAATRLSANTTAGFSIVTYTGTGANATVGHGLGVAPKMVIVKGRNFVSNWNAYNANLTSAGYYIRLNTTATQINAQDFWNSTTPTSTVFSLHNDVDVNDSGKNFVAYCFAEIPGYSKFGSYVGNGSANGPFVYCGFRPRYVMVKSITPNGYSWAIRDAVRVGYNPNTPTLSADSSSSEYSNTGFFEVDITANGFKIRSTGTSTNESGTTYIFAAFAEHPFGGSNVAPSPAR